MSKKKKPSVKKISFLTQRKNINDKFFDLVSEHTKKKLHYVKGKEVWKLEGVTKLAGELEISVSTLQKYIKQGYVNQNNDTVFINIERNFDKIRKVKRTKKQTAVYTLHGEINEGNKYDIDFSLLKKVTKEFTPHTFTFENFFKRKPFGKIKKLEQLYFRAGLYLAFKSGKGLYTIQNLPISHYSNKYPQGYREFFEIIKAKLIDYPSMKFFRFNYFDVEKINISSIEDNVKVFQDKNKGKLKRKPKKKK